MRTSNDIIISAGTTGSAVLTSYADSITQMATQLQNGNIVVVWHGVNAGFDNSSNGVFARIFTPDGNIARDLLLVNSYKTSDQSGASVIALRDGGFVVTWQSAGQDGSAYGIYAQKFNAAGDKDGVEFPVNTYTSDEQRGPSIALLQDGSFIIAWESYTQDGSGWGIYAQKFNADASKAGTEFQVNTRTASEQYSPSVAALKGSSFIIVWQSYTQDGSGLGIYAQKFNADTSKAGTEFQVNTYTYSDQHYPRVATLKDGSFVVVWQSNVEDGSAYGIYAQKFNADTSKAGAEFRVNTYTTNSQERPVIAALKDGGFIIGWHSNGQDGSSWGIYAQKFTASCNKDGAEFLVNSYTYGEQTWPFITPLQDGGFAIVYDNAYLDLMYMKLYNKDMQEICVGGDRFADGFSIASDRDGNSIDCVAKTSASGTSGLGIKCNLSSTNYTAYDTSSVIVKSVLVTEVDGSNRPFATDYNGKWLVLWDSMSGGSNTVRAMMINKNGDKGVSFDISKSGEVGTSNYGAVAAVKEDDKTAFAAAYIKKTLSSNSTEIYLRMFKNDGTTSGLAFKVAGKSDGTSHEEYPSLAYLKDRLVVAWSDRDTETVHTKIYNTDLDPKTLVSDFTVSRIEKKQNKPSLFSLGDKLLVAFEVQQDIAEVSNGQIFAQIIGLGGELINEPYSLSALNANSSDVFIGGYRNETYNMIVATWLEQLERGYVSKVMRIGNDGEKLDQESTIKSYASANILAMQTSGVSSVKTTVLPDGRVRSVVSNPSYCGMDPGLIVRVFDESLMDLKGYLVNIIMPVGYGYISNVGNKNHSTQLILQNKDSTSSIIEVYKLLNGYQSISTDLDLTLKVALPYGTKVSVDSKYLEKFLEDSDVQCKDVSQPEGAVWHREESEKLLNVQYSQELYANKKYIHVPSKSCSEYSFEVGSNRLYNNPVKGEIEFFAYKEDSAEKLPQESLLATLKSMGVEAQARDGKVIGEIDIGVRFTSFSLNVITKKLIPYCGIDQDQENYIQYNIGEDGFASKTNSIEGIAKIGGNEKWCNIYSLFSADFNGDGMADLLCHLDDGSNKIMLGSQNGFKAIQNDTLDGAVSIANNIKWCAKEIGDIHIADFNSDGKSDILCHGFYSSSIMLSDNGNFKSFANSTGFFDANFCLEGRSLFIGSFSHESEKIQQKDLFCKGREQKAKIFLASKSENYSKDTFKVLKIVDKGGYQSIHTWCINDGDRLLSGDFNGDGYTDFLCNTNAGNQIMLGHLLKATGEDSYYFKPAGTKDGRDMSGFIEVGDGVSNWCNPSDKMVIADFNHDGKDDLYCNQKGKNKFMLSKQTEDDVQNDYIAFYSINNINHTGELSINDQNVWCRSGNILYADFNGDGYVDLLCSGNQQNNIINI